MILTTHTKRAIREHGPIGDGRTPAAAPNPSPNPEQVKFLSIASIGTEKGEGLFSFIGGPKKIEVASPRLALSPSSPSAQPPTRKPQPFSQRRDPDPDPGPEPGPPPEQESKRQQLASAAYQKGVKAINKYLSIGNDGMGLQVRGRPALRGYAQGAAWSSIRLQLVVRSGSGRHGAAGALGRRLGRGRGVGNGAAGACMLHRGDVAQAAAAPLAEARRRT